ncbi:MAG: signal peptidase I [Flavisolibacter sp.]
MPLSHILIVYLISVLIVFLPSFGLAKMFQKAGVPSWKAYVPFYNTWIMQDLAKRPKHWVFWQFIPVVGWFISPGIFIEFVKLYGKHSLGAHTLAALFAPFYFPYLGYSTKVHYIGPEKAKLYKKPGWREWVDAAVFAIVAATLIRTFIFEAYVIPSGSMRKTLLTNDYLFVSKFSYGPRIPNTPLSIPFVHNYIPGTNKKSYSELIKLPYIRWFSSPVERGDVVVFNFPAGDTVINLPDFQSFKPYYDEIRKIGEGNSDLGRQIILSAPDEFPLAVHPPDKSDNYIKRCVGVAGDTLSIVNGVVHINSQRAPVPETVVMSYIVEMKDGRQADESEMRERGIELYPDEESPDFRLLPGNSIWINLTENEYKIMENHPDVKSITPDFSNNYFIFPYDSSNYKWTIDNFGPIWIPKKNSTLQLTPQNIAIYQRAIQVYEGHKLEERNGAYFIDGVQTNSYTFKMDYYWMMGDNRHGSQDSRFWGFVPEDRVVGKASLIWFSWQDGVRWKRIFRVVND